MPEVHAKLSPSAAERWMNCPGSPVLCMPFEETTSEYAAEGTLAHAVAEARLTGKPEPVHPATMDEPVDVYVNAVRELQVDGAVLHVEKKVRVTDEVWGTADAIVWDPSDKTLYVRDLKFGAGVSVEVSDNLQLKIYALAALLTMKYPAKLVNIGIVQPRLSHPDGHSRSKDYDVVDLLDFYADLREAVRRVEIASNSTPEERKTAEWIRFSLVPTAKGCRWCLAAPICPKTRQLANDLAKHVFAPSLPYEPEDLANVLDKLDVLDGWIKNVREFAYGEAEKGHSIPRYKLVEKRATRKWKPDVLEDLAASLGVEPADLTAPAEMKPITEIQKLCPGKNDKIRAAFLDPFVTKESSGHSLVPDTDNRPAVRLDAVAAFGSADAEP